MSRVRFSGTPIMLILLLLPLSASALWAQPATAEANAEMEGLAKDLAALLAEPGFRGFLRSEIAKSKNRENILELDKFLERAARRPGGPPGLTKLGQSAKGVAGRIKSSGLNELEGLDLYIPVDAHRAKWKGGEDFLVAFAPLDDEADIREIIAYEVKSGQRVTLDPNRPPEKPVLVLVAEEHESHEVSEAPKGEATEEPPVNQPPKPDVVGEDPEEKPVPQGEGNSFVGLRQMYIRDMKEPWTRGKPEIKLFFGIRKGNYCEARTVKDRGTTLESFDNERTWKTTWWWNYQLGPCYGTSYYTCWYFNTRDYATKMVIRIFEHDGGTQSNSNYVIYPGVTCTWRYYYSGDDSINGTVNYWSNFDYQSDYWHDLGNAYVVWHKR